MRLVNDLRVTCSLDDMNAASTKMLSGMDVVAVAVCICRKGGLRVCVRTVFLETFESIFPPIY